MLKITLTLKITHLNRTTLHSNFLYIAKQLLNKLTNQKRFLSHQFFLILTHSYENIIKDCDHVICTFLS